MSKRKRMMSPDEYRDASILAEALRAESPEMTLKEVSLMARDAIKAERDQPLMSLNRD